MIDEAGAGRSELAAVVAALAPTHKVPAAATAGPGTGESLGPAQLAWAAELAAELVDAVQERFVADPLLVPVDDIAAHVEALVVQVLLALTGGTGGAPGPMGLTTGSLRQLIAMGAPFGRFGEIIRLAHELVVRALLDTAIAQRASATTLTTITLVVTHVMDAVLDGVTSKYVVEAGRFSSSVERAHQEVIGMLIDGTPVDPHVVRNVLAVAIESHHRGFVVSGSASSRPDRHTLRRAVDVIRTTLNVSHVVEQENQEAVWVWATSPHPLHLDGEALATNIGSAVRVGVGSPQPMATGFRRTHLEAEAANRFGYRGSAGVIDYSRQALAILLSADRERARWFVESELGDLAVSSPRNRILLTTLRCYFDSKLRIAVAAERLHVHRNTAIARLEALEAILGHPVAERTAEVQSALAMLDVLDDDVAGPTRR